MNGAIVNLKSDILKLSIIFMLVLVFIPVATAMDSEDAFFEEYESDDEEIIVEHDNFEVEESTQIESSSIPCESHENTEESIVDQYETSQEISHEHEDVVQISELDESSEYSSQDLCDGQEFEADVCELTSQNLEDIIHYTNETCNELTVEEINVNVLASFFVSKYNAANYDSLIHSILYNESSEFSTSNLNRNLFKILELKNHLIAQETQTYLNDLKIDTSNDILVCAKITTDFAYSINNSIFGIKNVLLNNINSNYFLKSFYYHSFSLISKKNFFYQFINGIQFYYGEI